LRPGGDLCGKTAPAAEIRGRQDVEAQDDDTAHQQDELDDADPGAGFQAAGADVEPDDERHEDGAEGHRYAGNDVEQCGRGHQLNG
jgi:hypothetical protein